MHGHCARSHQLGEHAARQNDEAGKTITACELTVMYRTKRRCA
jgi:hypothetical protein